jgi:DNA-binding response OmpR family regulator
MESLLSSGSPDRLRIFIVETHADTMQTLRAHFEQLGHEVTCFPSPAEALALLPWAKCDILFSNIGRDGSGWSLVQSAGCPETVCCVAISGFGTQSDRARSKAAGFRYHLKKPFTLDEVDAILAEARRSRQSSS